MFQLKYISSIEKKKNKFVFCKVDKSCRQTFLYSKGRKRGGDDDSKYFYQELYNV